MYPPGAEHFSEEEDLKRLPSPSQVFWDLMASGFSTIFLSLFEGAIHPFEEVVEGRIMLDEDPDYYVEGSNFFLFSN